MIIFCSRWVKTIDSQDRLEKIALLISRADCRNLRSIIDDFTPLFEHLQQEERACFGNIKAWLYNEKAVCLGRLGVRDYNGLSKEEDRLRLDAAACLIYQTFFNYQCVA